MINRIFGLETEYAIIHYPEKEKQYNALSGTELFELLNNEMDKLGYTRLYEEKFYPEARGDYGSFILERRRYSVKKNRMFLGNGGRFYLDTGDHPEFATPECLTPLEVVIYDKAGERMLEELAHSAEKGLSGKPGGGRVMVFKNNVDIRGNTFGCHENYLVDRRRVNLNESSFFKLIIRRLIPFLISRTIITGAGKIFTPEGFYFQLSQRADFIDSELSSDTTFRRGIINSRDEPLSSVERFRRLHILVGDSNMSELSTYLKLGTTSLVLQLIEAGEFKNPIDLENPIQALREISRDPSLKTRVRLENGRFTTALELQWEYLKAVRNYFSKKSTAILPYQQNVFKTWEEVLKELTARREALVGKIDWVTKKWLIERYLTNERVTLSQLNRWQYLIRKMKSWGLEGALFYQRGKEYPFDVDCFLRSRLRQGDYLALRRHARYAQLSLYDYFKINKSYHGVIERDLKFHSINRQEGLFYLLRKKGLGIFFPGIEERIKKAISSPPTGTRAHIRGEFINLLIKKGFRGAVNWDSLTLYKKEPRKIPLLNPFSQYNFQARKAFPELYEEKPG
jgi:hypothetical protein